MYKYFINFIALIVIYLYFSKIIVEYLVLDLVFGLYHKIDISYNKIENCTFHIFVIYPPL